MDDLRLRVAALEMAIRSDKSGDPVMILRAAKSYHWFLSAPLRAHPPGPTDADRLIGASTD